MRQSPLSLAGRRLVGALALLLAVALVAVEGDRGAAAPAGEMAAAAGAWSERGDVAPAPLSPAAREVRPVEGSDAVAHAPADAPPTPAAPAIPDPPADEPAEVASPPLRVHVVTPGETPVAIAEQHGVRASVLTRANRHVRSDALQPGTRLVVPDPAADRTRTPQEAMAADTVLERLIEEIAQDYGWNPATVKAVAWVESRWDQHVVSNRGAIGVMQVQPATGALMAERVGRPLDLHDLRDNIEAGIAYLDFLHDRYGSDTRSLLAAYHQGPAAVRERGIYRISHRYADEILALRETFRAGG